MKPATNCYRISQPNFPGLREEVDACSAWEAVQIFRTRHGIAGSEQPPEVVLLGPSITLDEERTVA